MSDTIFYFPIFRMNQIKTFNLNSVQIPFFHFKIYYLFYTVYM